MPRRCESLQEFAKLKIYPSHHYHRRRSGSDSNASNPSNNNNKNNNNDEDDDTDNSLTTPTTPTDSSITLTDTQEHDYYNNHEHRHRSWTKGLRRKKNSDFHLKSQDDPHSSLWSCKTAPTSPIITNNNSGDSQSVASSLSSSSTAASSSSNKSKWPHFIPGGVIPKSNSNPPNENIHEQSHIQRIKSYFDDDGFGTVDPPEPPPRLIAHPPLRRRSSCPCAVKLEKQEKQQREDRFNPQHRSNHILCISDVLSYSQPGPTMLKRSKESSTIKAEKLPPPVPQQNTSIPPRMMRLRRRVSQRKENKSLAVWHQSVHQALVGVTSSPLSLVNITDEKKIKYSLTRKFILRELYTTEVTFWNQLYFAKVMFHDALMTGIESNSHFVKKGDFDLFANLFDLLQFSAKLLQKLQYFQFDDTEPSNYLLLNAKNINKLKDDSPGGCADGICIGQTMCDMATDMVVFLRCALDYKENVKILKNGKQNKGYKRYREKLLERRETRDFTLDDYLIIPIQRVARYNLLLTDLVRHTNPLASDYKDVVKAQKIVQGLAVAMNYAQK
ncbi:Dbl homology domain-containing protein [Circinella umbellata]|nr:Dbl homology domain-containing protein [Circinella umbellata]